MSTRKVVDASALADYLIGTKPGESVARLLDGTDVLDAPHLLITETLSVLRGWSLAGKVAAVRLDIARADLGRLPVELWDVRDLTERVWSLRHNVSAYDATYVTLAEALDAVLVTTDARLGAVVGTACRIVVAG